MKKLSMILFLSMLSITSAYADGRHGGGYGGGWGRGGGGWGWGGAWIGPALIGGAIAYDMANPYYPYYPYPVYQQPYPVYTQPVPVYAPAMQYWYFCVASNAYYPYVSSCPGGWQAVPATPPATISSAPSAPAR